MAQGGRKTQLPLLHEISLLFGPNSPLSGVLGVVPAGAILNAVHMVIAAAFNSTTNTLQIGTTPGGGQLFGSTNLQVLTRGDLFAAVAVAGPFAVDTPIYFTMTATGPAPTAGQAVAWVDYLPGPG